MKLLRVNMNNLKISMEESKEEYRLLGNRGLIARLVYDEIDPQCNPIGPGNKLIFATSPIDGLGVACAGRLSVGGKSPLTGGIKESNAGGVAATKLVKQGIKAIIVEGLPQKGEKYILHINKDGVELKPGKHLAGMGTYTVADAIYKEYGNDVGLITIGQAGEYLLGSAGVFINDMDGDPSRTAARGGMGAVMGAKGLKAVVIEDDGDFRPAVFDEKAFADARKIFAKTILEEPAIKVYTHYGTMSALMSINAIGGMPTLNYRKGTWEKAEEVSGDKVHDLILERGGEGKTTHRCMPGCVIQCSNIFPDESGKKIVAPLEYEAAVLLGPNLGISDLDKIALLVKMCNDYGLDAIEVGATLGVAAEVGLLKFGDAARAEELIKEIGAGTFLGRILGSGAVITGRVFGVLRVPAVKGQAMAGYEPRGIKGMSVTYAMSPMGADHTAGATHRADIDHQKPEGQMEVSRNSQVVMAYYDNFLCLFASRGVGKKPELIVNLVNAIYGTNFGKDFLTELGKEIIKLERAFNIAAGITQEYIPEFMKYEKLEPHGLISDISQDDYNHFWDKDFWGVFPKVKK